MTTSQRRQVTDNVARSDMFGCEISFRIKGKYRHRLLWSVEQSVQRARRQRHRG